MNSEANSSDTSVEATSIQLLQDLHNELHKAVISLGGKQKPAVQHKYYFYAAVLMNRIAHGFLSVVFSNSRIHFGRTAHPMLRTNKSKSARWYSKQKLYFLLTIHLFHER